MALGVGRFVDAVLALGNICWHQKGREGGGGRVVRETGREGLGGDSHRGGRKRQRERLGWEDACLLSAPSAESSMTDATEQRETGTQSSEAFQQSLPDGRSALLRGVRGMRDLSGGDFCICTCTKFRIACRSVEN